MSVVPNRASDAAVKPATTDRVVDGKAALVHAELRLPERGSSIDSVDATAFTSDAEFILLNPDESVLDEDAEGRPDQFASADGAAGGDGDVPSDEQITPEDAAAASDIRPAAGTPGPGNTGHGVEPVEFGDLSLSGTSLAGSLAGTEFVLDQNLDGLFDEGPDGFSNILSANLFDESGDALSSGVDGDLNGSSVGSSGAGGSEGLPGDPGAGGATGGAPVNAGSGDAGGGANAGAGGSDDSPGDLGAGGSDAGASDDSTYGSGSGSGGAGNPAPVAVADHTLSGTIATKATSGKQQAILTIAEVGNADHAYAKFMTFKKAATTVELDADTGFAIDHHASYLVSFEHAGGARINLSELDLEGAGDLTPGVATLDSSVEQSPLALTGIIDLDGAQPLTQSALSSTDGTGGNNQIADPSDGPFNALAGLGGKDTLSGSDDSDLLIGSGGADRQLGGAGDDILVFNVGDALMDGGTGTDILRIDDGARKLSLDPSLDHVVVDLTAKSLNNKIDGIEAILITEENTADADRGTTLKLRVDDVVDITGDAIDPVLTILGSAGDSVDLGSGWIQGASIDGLNVFMQAVSANGVVTVRIADDIALSDVTTG
jgi:hypothetical protein